MLGNAQADEAEVDVAKVVVSEGQGFKTGVNRGQVDDLQIGLYPRDVAHLPPSLENPQV